MKASTNPLTIREIQAKKRAAREAEQKKVRIKNVTPNQLITLQLYGKKSRKATEQLSISVSPGRSVELPENRIMNHQISNLKKRGMIRTSKAGIRKKSIEPVSNKEVKAKVVENVNIKKAKAKSSKKSKTKTNDEE